MRTPRLQDFLRGFARLGARNLDFHFRTVQFCINPLIVEVPHWHTLPRRIKKFALTNVASGFFRKFR